MDTHVDGPYGRFPKAPGAAPQLALTETPHRKIRYKSACGYCGADLEGFAFPTTVPRYCLNTLHAKRARERRRLHNGLNTFRVKESAEASARRKGAKCSFCRPCGGYHVTKRSPPVSTAVSIPMVWVTGSCEECWSWFTIHRAASNRERVRHCSEGCHEKSRRVSLEHARERRLRYICLTKIRHGFWEAANRHAENLNMKTYEDDFVAPYKCDVCGYWHVGHPGHTYK